MTLLTLAFSCYITVVVNQSTEAWNQHDKDSMQRAANRCAELYEDAPCLKTFTKREPRVYRALCGESK